MRRKLVHSEKSPLMIEMFSLTFKLNYNFHHLLRYRNVSSLPNQNFTFIHHLARKHLHRGVMYQLSVRLNHGTNDHKCLCRLLFQSTLMSPDKKLSPSLVFIGDQSPLFDKTMIQFSKSLITENRLLKGF